MADEDIAGDGTPEYKLIHFNTRFLAEPIRFIFIQASVPFEDIRVTNEEWYQMKSGIPFNQLPVLEFRDGKQLTQSSTICNYLARQFGLCGMNEYEAAQCAEIGDHLRDIRQEWRKVFFEKDEDKKRVLKKNFLERVIARFFGQMDKNIRESGTPWLVGDSLTWSDLAFATSAGFFQETISESLLEPYEYLQQLKDTVWNLPKIKRWLKIRPTPNLIQLTQIPLAV